MRRPVSGSSLMILRARVPRHQHPRLVLPGLFRCGKGLPPGFKNRRDIFVDSHAPPRDRIERFPKRVYVPRAANVFLFPPPFVVLRPPLLSTHVGLNDAVQFVSSLNALN